MAVENAASNNLFITWVNDLPSSRGKVRELRVQNALSGGHAALFGDLPVASLDLSSRRLSHNRCRDDVLDMVGRWPLVNDAGELPGCIPRVVDQLDEAS